MEMELANAVILVTKKNMDVSTDNPQQTAINAAKKCVELCVNSHLSKSHVKGVNCNKILLAFLFAPFKCCNDIILIQSIFSVSLPLVLPLLVLYVLVSNILTNFIPKIEPIKFIPNTSKMRWSHQHSLKLGNKCANDI